MKRLFFIVIILLTLNLFFNCSNTKSTETANPYNPEAEAEPESGKPTSYIFVLKWGYEGTGNGQFSYPHGIAVDKDNYVYVADTFNNRIQKFNSDGQYIMQWVLSENPESLRCDSQCNLYVAVSGQIHKYNSTGSLILSFGNFNSAAGGIAVDNNNGKVYATDRNKNYVSVFDPIGWPLTNFGNFLDPKGIDIYNDLIYIVNCGSSRVEQYSLDGIYQTCWGIEGTADNQLLYPDGLTIDKINEYVFIADFNNHSIKVFTLQGEFITKIGEAGSGNGQFNMAMQVDVDNSGNVFVCDRQNHCIHKFSPE